MKETAYACRIPPCSRYDIAGMESWLEDMAQKGLFLDKDGLFLGFATFVRDEPQQLRFRLEATDTNGGIFSPTHDPEDDAIQLHRQMGWHYRGRWGQFHIYASDDPEAPELHTDPRVQALTIQALNRFQRSGLWGLLAYTLMFWVFHGSLLFTFTAILGPGLTGLALIFCLSFPVMDVVYLVKMIRLKRQLKKGIPMSHRSDYRRRAAANYSCRAARWITGIFLFCSLFRLWSASVLDEDRVALTDWDAPLPFATVQDLVPEGTYLQESSFATNGLSHWSNFIATDNYDYSEWCEAQLPDGAQVDASCQILYLDTRFDWFALGLARELTDQYAGTRLDRLLNGDPEPVTLAVPGADYAVFFQRHLRDNLILCHQGTVIRIAYSRQLGVMYTPEEMAALVLNFMA